MLPSKTRYALKALTRLAHAQGPMMLDDIAHAEHVPQSFLSGILANLARQGLLTSKKGKGGGYTLAAAPSSISVARVIHLLDGPLTPPQACCGECPHPERCSIRTLMGSLHQQTGHLFRTVTLDQLAATIPPAPEALP